VELRPYLLSYGSEDLHIWSQQLLQPSRQTHNGRLQSTIRNRNRRIT
jgi:hypothetical protein